MFNVLSISQSHLEGSEPQTLPFFPAFAQLGADLSGQLDFSSHLMSQHLPMLKVKAFIEDITFHLLHVPLAGSFLGTLIEVPGPVVTDTQIQLHQTSL